MYIYAINIHRVFTRRDDVARPKRAEAAGRDEMIDRIKAAARGEMSEHGTAGLSLRRVARDLNITAPAIYNYFPRLDDLITALIIDAFSALAEEMRTAETGVASARPADRIEAMALAYRAWAVQHPVDFQLIYGNPIPGYVAPAEITAPLALSAFLGMFRSYLEAYESGELHVPPEYAEPPQAIDAVLERLQQESKSGIPAEVAALLASSWARIHGLVMLELFEHIQPLVGDPAAFYRYEVTALLSRLGFSVPGKSPRRGNHV
jgi:AcrR family transcriptional regulator